MKDIKHSVISNMITGTPVPAHMLDPHNKRRLHGINLDRLVIACERRGVDIHDIIAEALTRETRDNHQSGMTLKQQARLAWDIIDKAEPSRQAIKHSGDGDNPVAFVFSRDDEQL